MNSGKENHCFTQENYNILLNQNILLTEENKQLKLNLEATEKKLNWLAEQIRLNKQR